MSKKLEYPIEIVASDSIDNVTKIGNATKSIKALSYLTQIFHAHYNFKDEADGVGTPSGWTTNSAANVSIVNGIDGHDKVVQLTKGVGNTYVSQSHTVYNYGSFEFYVGSDDVANVDLRIGAQVQPGFTYGAAIFINTSKIWARHDGTSVDTGITVVDNVMYHIKIDYRESGAGAYKGLDAGTWDLYVDGKYIGNYIIYTNSCNWFAMWVNSAGGEKGYLDAWTYSRLTSDFEEWDNLMSEEILIANNIRLGDNLALTDATIKATNQLLNVEHLRDMDMADIEERAVAIGDETVKNKIYGTSGLYKGYMTFDNFTKGIELSGTISTKTGHTYTVGIGTLGNTAYITDLYGHTKCLFFHDISAHVADGLCTFVDTFDVPQSNGWWECYFLTSDTSQTIRLQGISGGNAFALIDINTVLTVGVTAICSITNNTWYHIKIEWECGNDGYRGLDADTYYVYLNGIKFGPFNATIPAATIAYFYWTTLGAAINIDYAIDAVGSSIDEAYGYHEGDNLLYDSIIDNDSIKTNKMNVTDSIVTRALEIINESKLYSLGIGIYKATENFALESDGAYTGGSKPLHTYTVGGGETKQIINNIDSHNKVLELYDNDGADYASLIDTFYVAQTSGWYEFYVGTDDITKETDVIFYDTAGPTAAIQMRIDVSKVQIYNAAVLTDIINPAVNDHLYHIKIEYETGAGGYRGLAADTFYITIDGVRYGPYTFRNAVADIKTVTFTTDTADSAYSAYVDALGASQDV